MMTRRPRSRPGSPPAAPPAGPPAARAPDVSSPSSPRSCCPCFSRWWTRPSWPPRCRRSRPTTGNVERASWIVVSYLIASTIAAPIYGRLGDAFGRRRLMFGALFDLHRGIAVLRRLADHRAAGPRPRAPRPRRRRPDDAVASADRRSHSAARARTIPGLSRGRRGVRQYVRAGRGRLPDRSISDGGRCS